MYAKGEAMKAKGFAVFLVFGLITFGAASAQENKVSGEVSVTAEHLRITGQKAKYDEYRDLRDGFFGDASLQYEHGRYYLDFWAEDAGRKTQSYGLAGGRWGSFKLFFAYDQLPHNFTFGAKSFYQGVEGANLSYPIHPPSTNVATWNSFDYSVERRNYSGGLKIDQFKPFFLNASISKENRKGLYPLSAAGTTPGGIAIELPSPVNYDTDNLKVEAGYIKNPLFLSLSYSYSKFQNDNSNLFFRNPATANTAATTDVLTLPPNNDQYKLDLQGAVKLPWNSKFNMDLSYARAQSDSILFNSYVADVSAGASNIGVRGRTGITLSDYVFNGKVDTDSYNFVLTSNPVHFLEGKAFYKYYNRSNKSDQITTTDTTADPTVFTNSLFGYRKQKAGAELGFRLPLSFYLTGGYTWVRTERDREDIPKNKDDIFNVDLRWSGADFMVAKIGYERLHRKAYFADPNDITNIETWVRRFDAARKDRDTYKAAVELFPLEHLSFTVGYKFKETNYKETTLGLQDDRRQEVNVDADYLIFQRVRLFGYFDWEYVKLHQFQRQFTGGTDATPFQTPTSTAFNWNVTQKENNYAYGLGTEIFIIPKKLSVLAQHNNLKSNGFADYTYILGATALPTGRTQDNIDINNWDSYRLTNYIIKAIYHMTPSLSFTGGWAYEKYVFDDAQYNGYQYVPAVTGTNGAFLTGAYSNPSYRANLFFLSAAYKF